MTTDIYQRIVALHASGLTLKTIARRTEVSVHEVRKLLRGDGNSSPGSTTDSSESHERRGRPEYFSGSPYHEYYAPTPEEIALACQKIQAEWSDEESASRKAFNPDEPQPWTAPTWSGDRLSVA